MDSQTLGAKRDFLAARIKNAEASATIQRGRPVVLKLSGTDDGLEVILPSTGAALDALQFRYGIVMQDLAVGDFGNAQIYGLSLYTILVRQTRAASTDTWASEDTLAKSIALSINTVFNALSTMASSSTQASNAAVSLSVPSPVVGFLAQTLASYASSASSTADTRVAITAAVKAFLRML